MRTLSSSKYSESFSRRDLLLGAWTGVVIPLAVAASGLEPIATGALGNRGSRAEAHGSLPDADGTES
jgi:hypothetical protein